MKIHGDEGWDKYPSYFDIFIPHILKVLDDLNLKITFFIVGKDTEKEENRKYLKMITDKGHEVGNHSYHHESWLQTYSFEKIEKEIINAENAIFDATGNVRQDFGDRDLVGVSICSKYFKAGVICMMHPRFQLTLAR
jgi:peptidoglycan-N-acetylglucosamine deacetylase